MSNTVQTAALAIALGAASTACGSAEAGNRRAQPPATQYIVGIDISGSRTPTQLTEAKQLLDGLIDRTRNGDRLVLVETYQGGTDAARQWEDSIPAMRDPAKPTTSDKRRVEDFHEDALVTASIFFDTTRAKQIKSTDLFGTLSRAADYARAANGRRTTVLLLSDMLQSTSEVSMEHPSGIPSGEWIAEHKSEGRLPDLRGVCVVVVGADVRSKRGAAVQRFWQNYFAATGADFRPNNYRNMISDPSEVNCR